LRSRASLDRTLRQAFGIEAQLRYLPSVVSEGIIADAQAGLNRAIWAHRVGVTSRALAGLVVIVLVVVGLFSLLAHPPLPAVLNPVHLLAVRQLLLPADQRADQAPIEQLDPVYPPLQAAGLDAKAAPSLSLMVSSIEPLPLHPGDSYRSLLLFRNDLPRSLDAARIDLSVSGPTGNFSFPLLVAGPFPAHGVYVIAVTPEILATQCEDRYFTSPRDIFGTPGSYRLRFTLVVPAAGQE
jgi:hypothetical protein